MKERTLMEKLIILSLLSNFGKYEFNEVVTTEEAAALDVKNKPFKETPLEVQSEAMKKLIREYTNDILQKEETSVSDIEGLRTAQLIVDETCH